MTQTYTPTEDRERERPKNLNIYEVFKKSRQKAEKNQRK
jgi:hypothetical protein